MASRIQHEIEHGRRIAERAEEVWNWSGPAGTRRWARRVELVGERLPAGSRVLEVGCGTGLLTEQLVRRGDLRVVAIDVSHDLLRRARARTANDASVSLSVQNAYATAFRPRSFDAVVGISVLHHLDLPAALAELHRVLRPGGVLVFSEPNMANPIILAQKNIPWLKRALGDSPDETAFFRGPLARALRAAGFEDVRVHPFDFLLPATPGVLAGAVDRMSRVLERIPVVREVAGSLFVEARSSGGHAAGRAP